MADVGNWKCDICDEMQTQKRYRRLGLQYCSRCKRLEFHRAICPKCQNKGLLLRDNPNAQCRQCEIDERVCIRCGTTAADWGRITPHGPVCASCSIYFRKLKTCSSCHKQSIRVYRSPNRAIHEPICGACLNDRIKVNCSACYFNRVGFMCSLDGKVFCEVCATQQSKLCSQCNSPMSAGRNKICRDCDYRNRCLKRIAMNKAALSTFWKSHYDDYGYWLLDHAGSLRASTLINEHWPFFRRLDLISQELGHIPTHAELMTFMTVLEMRRSLLVSRFLNEFQIIKIEDRTKEEAAEWDYMDRMKLRISRHPEMVGIFTSYQNELLKKLDNGKTTLRSVRLALTPAWRLLDLCAQLNKAIPDQSTLIQFLWRHRGQRAAISGFVSLLNNHYHARLKLPNKDLDIRMPLRYPKEGRENMLRKKLIDYLNSDSQDPRLPRMILRAALGYLHSVHLPKEIIIEAFMWRHLEDGSGYFMMGGWEFWLPREVVLASANRRSTLT